MLIARFYFKLIDYYLIAKPRNLLDASEYYTATLKTAISPTGFNLTSSSINRI
jgi:hypothetical protein